MALAEKILYADNARSTLASSITDTDEELSVQAGHGTRFPLPSAGECFIITVRSADGKIERMKATTRVGDTFAGLTRGLTGAAQAFTAGAKVEVRIGKLDMEHLVDQAGRQVFAVAGGTGNAITASFKPTFAALVNGMELRIRAPAANTGAVTLNVDNLGAKAMVKMNDQPLVAADIPGAGYEILVRYSSALDKWVLLNPNPRPTQILNPNYIKQTLVDQATIQWDMNLGVFAEVTLAGNREMANPTNIPVGMAYLIVRNDDQGEREISSWGDVFEWVEGVQPVFPLAPNAKTVIGFICDGQKMVGSYLPDVKPQPAQ
ncbi:MAG TPA: hypothetical protein VF193_14165 [Steroidobacter sp.]